MSIIFIILVFSLVVLVHEFGHYITAVKCGIKVEEFSIGMGPRIYGFFRGETMFSLKLFPIGGSCRMLGEDENNMDKRSFNSKPVGSRILVIVAGALFNFVLAFVLSTIVSLGSGYSTNEISFVGEGTPAQLAGLQVGDKVIKAGNSGVNNFFDFKFEISSSKGTEMTLVVLRDGEKLNFTLAPVKAINEDKSESYFIGIKPFYRFSLFDNKLKAIPNVQEKATFIGSVSNGFYSNLSYIRTTFIGFTRLVTNQLDFTKDVGGPIQIFSGMDTAFKETKKDVGIGGAVLQTLNFGALISANLGVLNLMPLPALDGGRLMFLILEAIRRKPVKPEVEGIIHFAGFVLLMGFAVFVAFNDVMKFIK